MPKEECLQYLDTDPSKVIAKAYDLTLNGTELSSGSMRITAVSYTHLDVYKRQVKTPPFHGGNTSSILVRVTRKRMGSGPVRSVFPGNSARGKPRAIGGWKRGGAPAACRKLRALPFLFYGAFACGRAGARHAF